MISIILLILISNSSFAGFSSSEKTYSYEFKDKKVKQTKKRVRKRKSNELDSLLLKLSKNDEDIQKILENNEKRILVRKSDDSLMALTRLRGVLLNSIIATNRKPTTLMIRLDDNEYFDDAKVRCHGLSYGKRVLGDCNLIVSGNQEFDVTAMLWDLDGAEGVLADQFYDGSEKEFLTSSFASFFEGVLQASKDTFATPYGQFDTNSQKNQSLSGLKAIASNANKKIKQSGNQNLQVALVNSGREVIVYFDKRVKL